MLLHLLGDTVNLLWVLLAQVLLLQSRDLDLNASSAKPVHAASKLRVG